MLTKAHGVVFLCKVVNNKMAKQIQTQEQYRITAKEHMACMSNTRLGISKELSDNNL